MSYYASFVLFRQLRSIYHVVGSFMWQLPQAERGAVQARDEDGSEGVGEAGQGDGENSQGGGR